MWVFLSRRLRTWLLAAVLLPFAGSAVHKLTVARRQHRPDARTTRLLGYADAGLMRINRRFARKRGRPEPVYA